MEFKSCRKCEQEKPIKEFHKAKNYLFGVSSICKLCKKNYDEKRAYRPDSAARRSSLKQLVDSLKNAPCTDCGEQFEPECMEFDHLRSKIAGIAQLIHSCCSLDTILSEIRKTELVCLLCHRQRSHERVVKHSTTSQRMRISRNQDFVNRMKSKPCLVCNKVYRPWQMDFNHINPSTKKLAIADMAKTSFSIKAITQEIAKCELLCSICHRRKTLGL